MYQALSLEYLKICYECAIVVLSVCVCMCLYMCVEGNFMWVVGGLLCISVFLCVIVYLCMSVCLGAHVFLFLCVCVGTWRDHGHGTS